MSDAHAVASVGAIPDLLLSAQHLTKRFGGLAAVDNVSVDLFRHRIHAVIGPNGAGKSTLTNLLSGDLSPTSGTIRLLGVEVAGKSPERISRLGLGRSYQKTNIFLPFTVWDNVRLASQARERHAPWNPLHWLSQAGAMRAVNQRCDALGVGTGSCADSDDAANTLRGLAKAGAPGSDAPK